MTSEQIHAEFRYLTRRFLSRRGAVLRLAEACVCHPDDILWVLRDVLEPHEFWQWLEHKPVVGLGEGEL